MYEAIPDELKALNQWCVWRLEDIEAKKATKVPYDAKSGSTANVNDAATWSSFAAAVLRCTNSSNYNGIGFIFTSSDPYTFIDLDDPSYLANGDPNPNYQRDMDRQIQIFKELDSYSEISPSGRGLHTIVKGVVPAGRRRSFIEIYSSQRYATFTGNVYCNKPIAEAQDKLMQLWEQMGSGPIATNLYKGDSIEKYKDAEIIDQAVNAVNGEKFQTLVAGEWKELYPSQSEADFAFIDIVAFYTQNKAQIERIYRNSKLGSTDKKRQRQDYINWMISKSFDRILPPIDFDGFQSAIQAKQAAKPEQQLSLALPPTTHTPTYDVPPGLLGELAQFIYAASPRPVSEVALAAAIGLMAGIAGRAYNVNGEGLNQYILLIAQSGIGKEAMALGIDKLTNSIKLQIPTSTRIIGPAEITSGEALIKYINNTSQCFVSILGEFGLRLQKMSDKRDNSQYTLKRMLLDLYHKSGYGRVFRPKIYSDKDKNISETYSPSFTILGETTPSTFYECLNEEMIADGLLPRFIIIEYKGIRVPLNESCANVQPPNWLVDKLASFVANCETLNHNKRTINITIDHEARQELNKFDKYADNMINKNDKEDIRQLWNRAHIKAWKLSGLLAVGINHIDPIITMESVKWALNIVYNDIRALSQKFESGEVGLNNVEVKQMNDTLKMIKEYYTRDDIYKIYKINKFLFDNKVMPYLYLNHRLFQMASFKNDRSGSTIALKRIIQILLDTDKIREIGKAEMATKYGTTQRSFFVKDMTILD